MYSIHCMCSNGGVSHSDCLFLLCLESEKAVPSLPDTGDSALLLEEVLFVNA